MSTAAMLKADAALNTRRDLVAEAIAAGTLTQKQLNEAEIIMGRGRMYLREACPWFRPLMLKLVPRWVPGLGTMAVSKGALMLVDPHFLIGMADEEVAFVLAHELMHLLLNHADRRGIRDRTEFNNAGDRAINCILIDVPALKMPTGARKGLMPSDINMPNGLTADEYYQTPKPQKSKCKGGSEGEGDGQDGEGEGKSKTGGKPKAKPGQGACGGCAGNPVEGEPDEAEGDADDRSPAELDRSARSVAEAIADAATKSQGNIPAGLLRLAQGMLTPAKVDWRKLLAAELRSAVQWAAGHTHHRWDAPSRRQAGVGFGAGHPILPRLRQPVPHVATTIDTSGSMSQEDMGAAAREVMGVLKAVGAPVTLCVCDAAVHGMREVSTLKEVMNMLKGGGGSDFRPAFEDLSKRKPRPNVLVFLTDGMISVPDKCPPWARVIWLVIGKDRQPPAKWGRAVYVDD